MTGGIYSVASFIVKLKVLELETEMVCHATVKDRVPDDR
jgi:hypothetical protein